MKYAYDNRMKAPCNAPIWGLAYDINNETEHRNYSCKPVLGEIRGRSFHKYKKGTTECQLAGVSIWARQYADTYEEAVELYNSLVMARIDTLYRLIDSAQKDLIPVNTTEGDT